MSNIDLGNAPVGTPPDAAQQAQLIQAIGIPDAAVMLTGNQTIAGQKTFSTAPRSTGTPNDDTSILNREQGDARWGYPRRVYVVGDEVVTSTAPVDILESESLTSGTYKFEIWAAVTTVDAVARFRPIPDDFVTINQLQSPITRYGPGIVSANTNWSGGNGQLVRLDVAENSSNCVRWEGYLVLTSTGKLKLTCQMVTTGSVTLHRKYIELTKVS